MPCVCVCHYQTMTNSEVASIMWTLQTTTANIGTLLYDVTGSCQEQRRLSVPDDQSPTLTTTPGLQLEPSIRLSYPINALFYVESVSNSLYVLSTCWTLTLYYIYIKKNSVYVLSTWRTLALSLCVCVYIYINLINPTLSLSTDQLSLALSIDKLYRSNSLSLSLYISFIDPSLCTYQDSLQNGLSLYKLYIQLSTDWTLSLYTTLCTLHRLDSLSI